MAELFVYDRNDRERRQVLEISRNVVAYCSDEQLIPIECEKQCKFEECLKGVSQLDFSVVEIIEDKDIEFTEKLREKYMDVSLLIIADASISPMKYLNPKIRANSLLLRPYSEEVERRTVREFFKDHFRRKEERDTDKFLPLKNRQESRQIPFSKIYYIEVYEKKLYVRLKDREYCQHGTLEQIQQLLPKYFLRCHRSYICNMNFVEKVRVSENELHLEGGIRVPLSRTYKSAIQNFFNEGI